MKWIVLAIALFVLYFYFVAWFSQKHAKIKLSPSKLTVYYGAPGVGKTTYAASLADRYLRCGIPVYSNVPINGCYRIDKSDIGKYCVENALLIWDEVGVDFHARNFKSNFTSDQIKFFKYHRHENVEVAIFSQGFDDMDKVLRILATEMYVIRRGFLPYTIIAKLIRKRPNIDENTHQPIDYYDFVRFATKRIIAPLSWKMFNSFERLGLPDHEFPLWDAVGDTEGREPSAAEHQLEELTDEDLAQWISLPVGSKLS